MLNTYTESQLHQSLKKLYSFKYNGIMEKELCGKICDIITADGSIIEIQTGNLSKLVPKLEIFLPDYPFHIVYPILTTKYIETRNTEGETISLRRSPKKQSIFSIFRELSGITKYLGTPHLTLEIPEISATEIRIQTEFPVQLPNKSRRFKKNWYKTDKYLNEIFQIHTFYTPTDYLQLLPTDLPPVFCSTDLKNTLVGNEAGIMLYVLEKMGIITCRGKKGRTKLYTIFPAQFF